MENKQIQITEELIKRILNRFKPRPNLHDKYGIERILREELLLEYKLKGGIE